MLSRARSGLWAVVGATVALVGLAVPATADGTDAEATGVVDGTTTSLTSEDGLVVSPDGGVFIRDEWTAPPEPGPDTEDATLAPRTARTLAAEATSPTDAFTLHSRPGATRSIFLDFDGGTLLSTNSWLKNGLSSTTFRGWSTDSSTAFSDAERATVIAIWSRVAEDFAPFDVDVTTQEPAAGGLWRSSTSDTRYGTRVAFTSGTTVQSALCRSTCGGVAWIGTFDSILTAETRSPAWVFPGSLSNSAKYMAEAASHEAGHTLGLGHDGTTTSSYYGGGDLWGPLMGSPYRSGVTQWSRGDYLNAGNHEDDLAIAVSNGAPLRADDAGNSAATAVALDTLPNRTGTISTRTDEDWLTVSACSGTVTLRADPAAATGANLDVGIEVRTPTGALLASAAPATTRTTSGVTGLGAAVSLPLTGGPFHLVVKGVGSGSGGTSGWSSGGYDDYGSLGTYRVSVAGCSGSSAVTPADEPLTEEPPADEPRTEEPTTEEPPVVVPTVTRPGAPAAPRVARGPRGGRLTIIAAWRPPTRTGGAAINGYAVVAQRISWSGRVLATRSTRALSASTRRVSMPLPRGRWVVRVKARNRVGWSRLSARSYVVRPR